MSINYKLLFFAPCLMLGTLITISSASWISAWMGLEINLMSMAPILINKMNYPSVEASIKYFLAQAIASVLLIFSAMAMSFNGMLSFNASIINSIILLAVLMKAGVAPLHFWFPQVMECSDWFQCFIILTWQKIAPFILLSFIKLNLVWFFILMSALVGALGGINQSNLKMILTYSSIIHSSWMITLIFANEMMWWGYFISYVFLTLSVIMLVFLFNLNTLSKLYNMNLSPKNKIILLINFLSIAGLPPFLGFMIKFMSIVIILNSSLVSPLILIMLIFSSFISFYYYLRMIYTCLFISSSKTFLLTQVNSINQYPSYFLLCSSLSIFGNFLFPLMVLLT
uniref:NADH-ubiquinone oxidoreductase chain 2 n=1 Tax=Friesea antarctica TaxID=2720488 RepID=B2BSD8_9HEXA|nr:NADH dehydrogenase subunit 2 [Friesea antarctica]ABS57591.1 NADH dehydrogenase subunit 2 [Friesea antarctica]